MVCDMLVTATGEMHAYQFFPAVIRSAARFTYTEVAAILANTRGPEAGRRNALVPHLLDLHDVYRALLKARVQRGAIDFETTETQIVCDENGRIEKIVPRTRNEAHRLIEESMLAANVCSADFIARAKHPALYRVHEGPTPEKKTLLQNYLQALGLGPSISDDPKPAEYQAIAAATKERPDAAQIHTDAAALDAAGDLHEQATSATSASPTRPTRTSRARSGAIPTCSCTASSRRCSQSRATRSARAPSEPAKKARLAKSVKAAKSAHAGRRRCRRSRRAARSRPGKSRASHCSANERRADEASRDVEAWLKCRYMREHLGEEFGGAVSAVTSFGLFVQLDGLYVEGLVHVTELGGEYFRFDEVRQELRGERIGAALRRRHARARAGQPGRSRRPQDRFPPRPRWRGCGDARCARGARGRSSATSSRPSEIVALEGCRPRVKAVARRRSRARSGARSRPVARRQVRQSRKAASRRDAGARGTSRRWTAAQRAIHSHRQQRERQHDDSIRRPSGDRDRRGRRPRPPACAGAGGARREGRGQRPRRHARRQRRHADRGASRRRGDPRRRRRGDRQRRVGDRLRGGAGDGRRRRWPSGGASTSWSTTPASCATRASPRWTSPTSASSWTST